MKRRYRILPFAAVLMMLAASSASAEIVNPDDYSTPRGTWNTRLSFSFDQTQSRTHGTYNTFAFAPAFRKFVRDDFSVGAELYVDWTTTPFESFSRQAVLSSFQYVGPTWDMVRPFVDAGVGVSHFGYNGYFPAANQVGVAGKGTLGAYVFISETIALSPSLTYYYDSEVYGYRYPGVNELIFFMGIDGFVRR